MRIILTAQNGLKPHEEIQRILRKIKSALDAKSGRYMAEAVSYTVKNHFSTIYSGSNHYNPDKVKITDKIGNTGAVDIDVPGITRAYHNLDIRLKTAKHLTIPMHREAYGISPRQIPDLFYLKKKDGKEFLAKASASGGLIFMYFLSYGVHQRRDSRLMPSDETLYENMIQRISAMLKREKTTI